MTKNSLNETTPSLPVRELQLLAKECGLKGYSKLRKAELFELILQSKSRFQDSTRVEYTHVLDEPVVDNTSILQQTVAIKLKRKQCMNKVFKRCFSRILKKGNKIKSELNAFADSVIEYVPRAVKEKVSNIITKVNDIFNTVYKNINFRELKPFHKLESFEVRKALKGTVKQYTIDGVSGYDTKTFLDKV